MKKHIVCIGDSNTHGFCAELWDSADHAGRFNEEERWTCRLQAALGEQYLVLEEGLNSRTTVFPDPFEAGKDALGVIEPLLLTHEPVDLAIVMLGTNDTKHYFHQSAEGIADGLRCLLLKMRALPCWSAGEPQILVLCPPPMGEGAARFDDIGIDAESVAKSRALAPLYAQVARELGCAYLNTDGIAEVNHADHIHLTARGHARLAAALAELVPVLIV